MSKYWFRPRRYGIGATPSAWQGWALLGAYLAALFALAATMRVSIGSDVQKPLPFVVIALSLTGAFIWLTWKKTDGAWRWRWGERE
jgi:hypothetical protein